MDESIAVQSCRMGGCAVHTSDVMCIAMLYSAGLQVEPDLFRLDEVKEQRYFPFIPSSSLPCHAHSLHSADSQVDMIHSISCFLFPWDLIMCSLFLHLTVLYSPNCFSIVLNFGICFTSFCNPCMLYLSYH